MEWVLSLVAMAPVIALIMGIVESREPKAPKEYIFQEQMIRRHDDKRRAEHWHEITDWDTQFKEIESHRVLREMNLETDKFVPAEVLVLLEEIDEDKFKVCLEHNLRLEHSINNRKRNVD